VRALIRHGAVRASGLAVSEKAVAISKTRAHFSRLMMPTDANPMGNVYGGSIVKYIDEVASVVAIRHARSNVVTASIDRMDFFHPVYIGNLLVLKAALNFVGHTSMEVGVRVEAEDLKTGKSMHTGSCYLTMVALDQWGKPSPVGAVAPTNDEERGWFNGAKERRDYRKRTRARDEASGD
jgi:acyl-CoA hydrolase